MKALSRLPRFLTIIIAAAALVASAWVAHASVSKSVEKKFKGRILVTDEPLPMADGESDGETIKLFEKLNKKAVQGAKGEEASSWTFHYTAFLKQPSGTSDLSLDFHKLDKDKTYVANSRLSGVDPKLTIVTGMLTIDENEGPAAGTTYDLVLRAKKGSKEIELARTRVTLK
jgi:hypothetical protein